MVLGAKARPGSAETTTVPPCRAAAPPTAMRSLWPWPTTSARYVPLAAFTKLPATLSVPIELPGATTPKLAKLPTVPLPDSMPTLLNAPLTTPLLMKEPALLTLPVRVPVLVALPPLIRSLSIVPLFSSVP